MTIGLALLITFIVQTVQLSMKVEKIEKKEGVKNASVTRSVATEKPKNKK